MRRFLKPGLLTGVVFFVFSGCAMLGTPPEISETKDLLEKARQAGAAQNCPQAFQEAQAALQKAQELCPCETKKAKAQAEVARAKVAKLCTDTDGDGVPDELDECPNTPAGVRVDDLGCAHPLDADGDGVLDADDQCPDTPADVQVDAKGCPLDSDGDGVFDYVDRCAGTPQGAAVTKFGCWDIKNLYFATDKSKVRSTHHQQLNAVLKVMQENPGVSLVIQGHTDTIATDEYNQVLSEKRAEAVRQYFLQRGIGAERLEAEAYGEKKPAASNLGPETRRYNRRVELHPSW